MLRRTKISLVMVQPAGSEPKGGPNTTTAARAEFLIAAEKQHACANAPAPIVPISMRDPS
jgi:hypothetical protein